ncbi:MAG TPA: serine dehydratase beta chain, partial [Saprospiraceae bacterium]|nr:serine dehydratase beta chain [Saprospiraceae bacterium]
MESISIFEMIKIGIGPSSSHTMGPWKAAQMFVDELGDDLEKLVTIYVHLYGSLAKTGKGHGTDVAVLIGLTGADYTQIDTREVMPLFEKIREEKKMLVKGKYEIPFIYDDHLIFDYQHSLPYHPNGMTFIATLENGVQISRSYYSVGGGFVATEYSNSVVENAIRTPYPCHV